jgi:GTP cyclohydrolase I
VNGALFDVEYDEMIVVKDIEYFSMCEHHMLPFYGRAHVAYIPSDKIIGLSKIPRIVEMFARRLQVQERMTREIAELIDEVLNPQGVAVVLEGSHMCSMMRGVKKEHARMVTSAMLGCFKQNEKTRNEFMQHLRQPTTPLI